MNKRAAAQVFTFFAIGIGLGVSYYPPVQNANAIWGLVGTFIGFAMHDLFDTVPSTPPAPLPKELAP